MGVRIGNFRVPDSTFREAFAIFSNMKRSGLSREEVKKVGKASVLKTIKELGQGKDPVKDESFFDQMMQLYEAILIELYDKEGL